MKPVHYVVIGLVLIIAALILFDKDPEPYDTTQWKQSIQRANDRISNLRTDSLKLASKIIADSVRREKERKAYKNEVKKKSSEIARMKQNPRVVYIRENEPSVDSLLTAMESKDSIQSERIEVLEKDNAELRVDMKTVNDNCAQMLAEERDKFKASQEFISDLEKQNRKEKRKRKLATILIPIVGVGALFLGGL